jgi:hypothetical protein
MASPRYVQDMWELLAKLEGELTKEAGEGARGISVLILNNGGATPLDPEVFQRGRAPGGAGGRVQFSSGWSVSALIAVTRLGR